MKQRSVSEGGAARREAILMRLRKADAEAPLSASALAAEYGVSRQVIVGDIALLRTAGHSIDATPRGYVLRRQTDECGIVSTLLCCHSADDMVDELNLIVDCGCTVLDVSVEHPVYGTLTGALRLSSRWDVAAFAERVRAADALPLSALTEGVHIHNITAPTPEQAEEVKRRLAEKGYLVK